MIADTYRRHAPWQPKRRLMRILASFALAGLFAGAGCSQPPEEVSNVEPHADTGQTPPSSATGDLNLEPDVGDAPDINDRTDAGAPTGENGDAGLPEVGPDTAIDDVDPDAPAAMSEDAFLATYAELEGVVRTATGLMYRIMEEGDGDSPTLNDRVQVTYRGTLMTGEVFDETADGQVAEFRVGSLIRGWQEALPLMKEGATWDLIIPSYLAYGERGTDDGTIGPNQPLIFELTLVAVL